MRKTMNILVMNIIYFLTLSLVNCHFPGVTVSVIKLLKCQVL